MVNASKMIAAPLYHKMQKLIPITCIDAIIKTDKGVLLGIRNNEPVKGKAWFVGGRVRYGESVEAAVIRIVKAETGLDVKIERLAGVYSCIFHKGEQRHTICPTFIVKKIGGRLHADSQNSGFIFIDNASGMVPYVKRVLNECGVFGKKSRPAEPKVWTMVVD